jgi:hypothetical protein
VIQLHYGNGPGDGCLRVSIGGYALFRSAKYLLFLLTLVATPALAQAPAGGTYTSTDIGGTMLPGRYSVSWPFDTAYGAAGNVLHVQSWDGASLGTQWSIHCPIVSSNSVVSDSVDADGYHHLTGKTYYGLMGGLSLDGSGPWGGGEASYDFDLMDLQETVSIVGTDTEILSFTAAMDGTGLLMAGTYIARIDFHATRVEVSNTDKSLYDPHDHPFYYPLLLDMSCLEGPWLGTWGTVTSVEFLIQSSVGTQETTWGAIKSVYH